MLPAHERLDAGELAGVDVELGLVVQHELALANRARQLGQQLEARRVVAVELLVVHGMRQPGLLGHVHGDIGALQQRVDVAAVRGEARHADAGLDVERQAIGLERQLQRGEDALEGLVEVVRGLRQLPDEDAELVAAEARDGVAAAQDGLEAPRELDQQEVAVAMPQRVVDLLEAVEVHEQDGELRAVSVGDADRVLDLLPEARAVRQAREVVVERLVAVQLRQPPQLGLRLLARRDVAADALHADRAAVLLDHAARHVEDHGVTRPWR